MNAMARKQYAAREFERNISVEAFGGMMCRCEFTAGDGGTVYLKAVHLWGWTFSAAEFAGNTSQADADAITAEAQEWWSNEGLAQARDDELANWADYQREEV